MLRRSLDGRCPSLVLRLFCPSFELASQQRGYIIWDNGVERIDTDLEHGRWLT
jgi:hypothetical protein